MNLYIDAAGRFVGTQDDAKKAGKGWRAEQVPTDKPGLIDYLNAMTAPAPEPEIEDVPLAAVTPPPPVFTRPDSRSVWIATDIETFILETATIGQVENLFACLGNRFAALAKKAAA